MKVGDKIKGFKHAGDVEGMQKYIGEIGTIVTLTDYDVEIKFSVGESWFYPLEEAKKHLVKDEPKDSIVESVINQYKERSEVGIKKYNNTMDRDDLSTLDWLTHLQQEMMDATLYIEKLKKQFSNEATN